MLRMEPEVIAKIEERSDPVVRKVAPAPSLRGPCKVRAAKVEKEESEAAAGV